MRYIGKKCLMVLMCMGILTGCGSGRDTDVYLEEEDGIVLADYKTDLVKDPKELILRYRVQLDYYEEALVRLTGKCVKEKLIYSFGLEQEITL